MPLSDDELMAFAEANKPCKVERLTTGEILVMTPGGFENNRRGAFVVHELYSWAEVDGRGEVFSSNAGFNLPDGSTLSPDAGWVQSSRLASLTELERERFLPFAPDFVIEILSPSDSRTELEAKMKRWIENGVSLAWSVDPFEGIVVIYSAESAPVILHAPEIVKGGHPIAGFALKMARIWA